jgi:hypothetical protein
VRATYELVIPDPALREELLRWADANECTVGEAIVHLLKSGMEKRKAEAQEIPAEDNGRLITPEQSPPSVC